MGGAYCLTDNTHLIQRENWFVSRSSSSFPSTGFRIVSNMFSLFGENITRACISPAVLIVSVNTSHEEVSPFVKLKKLL